MCPTSEPAGLWFIDFDGTIKPEDGPVAEADLEALEEMGRTGWIRVVATGRSLYAFQQAWSPDWELDYLIFSSGAGLAPWTRRGPGELLYAARLQPEQTLTAARAARDLGYGFFAYLAPPDDHRFFYHYPDRPPPKGFCIRLERYADVARPCPESFFETPPDQPLSQFLIMVPAAEFPAASAAFERAAAPELVLGCSTSPFGDGCLWLEVHPSGVSKGLAAARLARRFARVEPRRIVALGNDYNDIDLLDWAGRAWVAADAPRKLLDRYPAMPPAGRGGLAQVWQAIKKETLP